MRTLLPVLLALAASSAMADPFAHANADAGAFVADDELFAYNPANPLYPGQWNLLNEAPSSIHYPEAVAPNGKKTAEATIENAGLDMRVAKAWRQGYTGSNLIIGILDDGMELNHPDLNVAREFSIGFDGSGAVAGQDGSHGTDIDHHGTCVAGMAAATGGNGIGVTGPAPLARVASIRINNFSTIDDYYMRPPGLYWQAGLGWRNGMSSAELEGLTRLLEAPVIAVKNSSSKAANFSYPPTFADSYSAFARIAANGVLFCQSAGNCRGTRQQDTNMNMEMTSPYVTGVAALGSDGKYALYSSFGSAVAVTVLSESAYWNVLSLPGGHAYANGLGVSTTDRIGAAGMNYEGNGSSVYLPDIANLDYTSQFDGTSAAAPSMCGILALAKQANPNLNARMVKHLLARTSMNVDANDASASSTWVAGNLRQSGWQKNRAGVSFNPDYGFGLADASALVDAAIEAEYVTSETLFSTGLRRVNKSIPAGSSKGIERSEKMLMPKQHKQPLESVEVYLKISGGDRSEWEVVLSKGKTSSRLWMPSNDIPNINHPMFGDFHPEDGIDHAFVTHAFWGEDPDGEWKLSVTNPSGSKEAVLESWGIVGHMGRVVFDRRGTARLGGNTRTQGFSKNRRDSTFVIGAGKTLSCAGDVLINGGRVSIDGKIAKDRKVLVSKLDKDMKSIAEDLDFARGMQVNIQGGTVSGRGAISAPAGSDARGGVVLSGGILRPGTPGRGGVLRVGAGLHDETSYRQTGGTLWIDVLDNARYGRVRVQGDAEIGGRLRVVTSRGFAVKQGTRLYDVVKAKSVSGSFRTLRALIPGTGLHWEAVRREDCIDLVAKE